MPGGAWWIPPKSILGPGGQFSTLLKHPPGLEMLGGAWTNPPKEIPWPGGPFSSLLKCPPGV